MVQSVELLLDDEAERAVLAEWDLLGDAGLPTSRRPDPPPSHRPHITLLATETVTDAAEAALAGLARGLDLTVRIGAPLLFTKRRRGEVSMVLVRQVVTTVDLLRWQQAVVEAAGPGIGHDFEPGSWTPHVTLARRYQAADVAAALAVPGLADPIGGSGIAVRRWDSDARRDWLVG